MLDEISEIEWGSCALERIDCFLFKIKKIVTDANYIHTNRESFTVIHIRVCTYVYIYYRIIVISEDISTE